MADTKPQPFKMPEPGETVVLRATNSEGETITLTFGELKILKKLIDAANHKRK